MYFYHPSKRVALQGNFSLLFHASIDDNLEAFSLLISAGADPTWINQSGTTVLKLIVKRNQLEMAKLCITNLNDNETKAFVNHASQSGNYYLYLGVVSPKYEGGKCFEWSCVAKAALTWS